MYSLDPFEGKLGFNNAAHLLRRATFGPSPGVIEEFAELDVEEAVNGLFQAQEEPPPPIDPATGEDWVSPHPGPDNSGDYELWAYFAAWQMELMRKETNSIREKITWFFHTHMPVSMSKVIYSHAAYYQNKLYRHFAFGSFKTLFRKLVIDNAMLWYLDNTLNYVGDPNENFAREMLELYTIGKGPQIGPGDYTNYTEDDIKAAARVLTGYLVDLEFTTYDQELISETKIAQGYVYTDGSGLALLHDAGTKKFSEKFQHREIEPSETIAGYATEQATLGELEELIDMIFDQDETAKFLVRKLYRFFVDYNITDETEEKVIGPLAQTFRDSNYSMEAILKRLLKSKHFFDVGNASESDNRTGAMIKSPLDLLIGSMRYFRLDLPTNISKLYIDLYFQNLLSYTYVMGMQLYNPEDVAGYPAYFQEPGYNRNWITPTNLAFRYYPVYAFIIGIRNESDELLMKLNIVEWVEDPENIKNPEDAKKLIREMTDSMFSYPIPDERLDYYAENIFMDGLPLYYWTTEWVKYKNTGDDTIVNVLLSRLLIGLMQSPEFQLM